MRLVNRVALVTGSSRGIGRAIARALTREGASVVVNSRARGPDIEATLAELGDAAHYVAADVSDPNQAHALVNQAVASLGRLDILVNNAGIRRDALLATMTAQQWTDVLAVNLGGAFNCLQAAIEPMALQGSGCIINISSMVAERVIRGQANYAAAKAGLNALTRAAAAELARFGIRVNAVAPGAIETDLTRDLLAAHGDQIRPSIALGHFGQPEDVAAAVVYLADDDARYVTGEILHVSGGLGLSLTRT